MSQVKAFRHRELPEPSRLAGYAALIDHYDLRVPLPSRLAAIADRSRPGETPHWLLLTRNHARSEDLAGQLEFALKWEGIDLGVLKALFAIVPGDEIARIVAASPTGAYARRLWFVYEWLTDQQLDVADPGKVRAVLVVDPSLQYAAGIGEISSRHKVRNNLPGTRDFCPLVRKSERLREFESLHLDQAARRLIDKVHPDVVHRAAAFLLLADTRASFQIEGESPSPDRARRWGQAIASAGAVALSTGELDRLQRILIPDDRFVELGPRRDEGFVGKHDRQTREPIPEHVSARARDVGSLLRGIVEYESRGLGAGIDPVAVAAAVSFGFVYVHPYVDGNGRLHRWLIHHTLARGGFNPSGVVFPVSAVLLRLLSEYSAVLRGYSGQLLDLIEWRPTVDGNVDVLNDTADYYRFFDATPHAEFLYRCVQETVEHDLPEEIGYLQGYDRFSREVQGIVDLPQRTVELLVRFLTQGNGKLSKRARRREFADLSEGERERVEALYAACFSSPQ